MIKSLLRDYRRNIDLDYWTILWCVLSSGAPLYTSFNNGLSTVILLLIAFLYIRKNGHIEKKNFRVFFVLMGFMLFSTIYNSNQIEMKITDLITLPIKFFSVLVITSKISYQTLRKKYVMVMGLIATVSLPCFFLYQIVPEIRVPGTMYLPEIPMYGSFYYNYGSHPYLSDLYRNAGVFLEGGLHAVYEVIAVMFVVSGNSKYKKLELILFTVTIITTFSSTGLLTLLIVLLSMVFIKGSNRVGSKALLGATLLIVCLIFESTTGLITSKLVGKGGSYITRYDDTLVSLKIAVDNHPIVGNGPAAMVDGLFDDAGHIQGRLGTGVVSRSNGVANFAIKWGFIVTGLYFILVYYHSKKIFCARGIVPLLFTIVIFINLNSQPIMITPFFYTFFFNWKKD